MALPTDTIIRIGELVVHNFSHLEIIQKIHDHHTFTLEIAQDLLETKFKSAMPAAENLMGQRISIEIKPIQNFDDPMILANPKDYIMQFSGIIQEAVLKIDSNDNIEKTVLINGHSLSKLLDDGAESNSFTEKTLADIVNKIKSDYHVDMHVRPHYKDVLAYAVQYNESGFDFINRMAMRYGQWLYDTGQTIVFGTPGGFGTIVTLAYGVNLQDFSYKIRVVPTLFKTIENDNRTGEYIIDNTAKYRKEADGFHQNFIDKSNQVFNKETVIQLNQNAVGGSGKNASQEYTRNKMRAVAGKLIEVNATSDVPGITLGSEVKIMGVDRQHETHYRVTEIIHTCDDSGGYKNHFTAINFNGAVFSPKTNPDLVPYCQSQSAIVIDNYDPDGLSAVRVQMPWQALRGETTPYIPLLQQYGGNGKGSHIMPEIGEIVLVEFQGGNAEMPMVTGTLPNIKEKSGYSTPNNDIKVLHSRSNNVLLMNDATGSMLLRDSSKSFIEFDGKRKVELNADVFVVNVKRIIFNASESTEINTNDYMLKALSRIYIFSRVMKQHIKGLMSLYSGKALINSNDTIDIEAKVAKLHGSEYALMHSDKEALINSKGTATLQGGEGNNYSNDAVKVDAAATEVVALAVVYFRPTGNWKGEYGFDWLREKDNGLAIEPDYESIIEGGYKDGKSDLDKIQAYAQLTTEYEQITITRKTPNSTASALYYVPYLTLFSQEFVKAMPADTLVKPQYKADLKVVLDINEDLEKLKFEYDDTLFTVDATKLTQNKKTQGLTDPEISITITCLKDLDSNKYIDVYAYPKGTEANHEIENRKLAGRIKVLKNDSTVRKEEKFVLATVKTILNEKKEKISFNPEEMKNLYNSLHQAFIIPRIEETIMDLSTHVDFQINGKHIDQSGHLAYKSKTNYNHLNPSLHPDVQKIFFEHTDSLGTKNEICYDGYFTIFKFGIGANQPDALGAAQGLGVQNVLIFNSSFGYSDATLSHEVLHGLGLCHTHRDSDPLYHINCQYIYPKGALSSTNATDNIMSYSRLAFTSWRWQWKIINTNIKIK